MTDSHDSIRLAERIGRVAPSPTLAITAKAAALKAAGEDVIGFGAGQPDFDTPEHIKAAARAALDGGMTKYTPAAGTAELRAAVAEQISRERGLSFDGGNVIISCGGKHALYNLFAVTLDPGDEVLIPAPYWVSYPEMAKLADGVPKIVPTRFEDRFCLRPEALEAAITEKTRWLVLNSPSNPTGSGYGPEDLRGLVEVLKRHPHVAVCSDDIYDKLTFGDFRFTSILDPAIGGDALESRTVIVSGASKTYSMTGWRIGWTVGPKPLIAAMAKLQSQSTSNPTSFAQAGALAAVQGSHDFLGPFLEALSRRRQTVMDAFDTLEEVRSLPPDGAFYAFPDFSEVIARGAGGQQFEDDLAFCGWLLEAHGVALVPGSAFGAPGFARLSFALDDDSLRRGLDRIIAAVRS